MPPTSPYAAKVQTVSELTQSIRGLLETSFSFVTVCGEISNLRQPYSGHLYFTLKDRDAQIRVVLFKGQQRYLDGPLQDGQQVICRGRVSVYEPRGEYQIIADSVDSQGTGVLQIAFDQLKRKLENEGLFDSLHKKELPFLPEKIFLITSPKGAALFDFLHIAEKRFPAVLIEIIPVKVQGEGAAGQIAEAISLVNSREDSGVIVLCRGGGSLEDLWAFNEEKVARAIFASNLPVVSAVGHEVDFSIADFVADHRSPTPTAAAKDVLPDRDSLKKELSSLANHLTALMLRKIEILRQKIKLEQQRLGDPSSLLSHFRLVLDNRQICLLQSMTACLHRSKERCSRAATLLTRQNPAQKVMQHRHMVDELAEKLVFHMQLTLAHKRKEFEKKAVLLDAVSPLAVLSRGYGIIRRKEDNVLIRSSQQVAQGDILKITLHQGEIESQVTSTKK